MTCLLPRLVPVYENIVLRNSSWSCYFCATLQLHNVSVEVLGLGVLWVIS